MLSKQTIHTVQLKFGSEQLAKIIAMLELFAIVPTSAIEKFSKQWNCPFDTAHNYLLLAMRVKEFDELEQKTETDWNRIMCKGNTLVSQ